MTFSNDIKLELSNIVNPYQEVDKAELFGVLKTCGTLLLRETGLSVLIITEKAAVARHILKLLKKTYGVRTETSVIKSSKLRKNNNYHIRVVPSKNTSQMIKELNLLPLSNEADNPLLDDKINKRAFLRGIFLGNGNVTDPNIEYHLELKVNDLKIANIICEILSQFSVPVKTINYREKYIVYVKNFEGVSEFLNIIGAHQAMMSLDNFFIVRDVRNAVNRKVNCETANLEKTIAAAVQQTQAINYIIEVGAYDKLNTNLKEAAKIRLEHPEESLNDLVKYFEGLSKSGIRHRLKKLCEMANSLGMNVE